MILLNGQWATCNLIKYILGPDLSGTTAVAAQPSLPLPGVVGDVEVCLQPLPQRAQVVSSSSVLQSFWNYPPKWVGGGRWRGWIWWVLVWCGVARRGEVILNNKYTCHQASERVSQLLHAHSIFDATTVALTKRRRLCTAVLQPLSCTNQPICAKTTSSKEFSLVSQSVSVSSQRVYNTGVWCGVWGGQHPFQASFHLQAPHATPWMRAEPEFREKVLFELREQLERLDVIYARMPNAKHFGCRPLEAQRNP